MTSRHQDKEEGFLSRWSQRKQAARAPEPESETEVPTPDAAAESGEESGEEAVRPEDLPDVETLTAESDFSAFMKKGVPEPLKQRALRKLWRVDPAFKHICMLDDYNLDYTDAAMVVPNMKTLYQVGKGMVVPVQEAVEKVTAATDEVAGKIAGAGEEVPALPDESPEESHAEPSAESRPEAAVAEESEQMPQEEGEQEANPAEDRKRARNPGDPLVASAPAQRRSAPRNQGRSALRRRWGEAES